MSLIPHLWNRDDDGNYIKIVNEKKGNFDEQMENLDEKETLIDQQFSLDFQLSVTGNDREIFGGDSEKFLKNDSSFFEITKEANIKDLHPILALQILKKFSFRKYKQYDEILCHDI